jgi:DNA primase
MTLRDSIAQCKSKLPMADLLLQLGLGEARRSMRSPFRDDRNPSALVFQVGNLWFFKDFATGESGDEIWVIQRHTGCTKEEAIKFYHELAGVRMPRKSKKASAQFGKIVAVYDYLNAGDRLVHQTVRYEPKQFRQRRPAARGERAGNKIAKCDPEGNWWLWTLAGIEPVLYRLPQLLAADPELPVVVCEGEKDCIALAATGAITTTVPMGAGKWRQSYSDTLKGRNVIIAADRDPVG